MNARNQGGWVASFFIIGAVLLLGLLGGLYYLKTMSNKSADTAQESGKSSTQTTFPDTTDENTEKSTDDAATTKNSGNSNNSEKSDEDKAAADQTPAKSTTDNSKEAVSADLPSTGPTETAYGIAAVALLTFAGFAFIQSRKA